MRHGNSGQFSGKYVAAAGRCERCERCARRFEPDENLVDVWVLALRDRQAPQALPRGRELGSPGIRGDVFADSLDPSRQLVLRLRQRLDRGDCGVEVGDDLAHLRHVAVPERMRQRKAVGDPAQLVQQFVHRRGG